MHKLDKIIQVPEERLKRQQESIEKTIMNGSYLREMFRSSHGFRVFREIAADIGDTDNLALTAKDLEKVQDAAILWAYRSGMVRGIELLFERAEALEAIGRTTQIQWEARKDVKGQGGSKHASAIGR